ncbi:MAG: S6 family peptidase, partial [Pseudomonas sp.]
MKTFRWKLTALALVVHALSQQAAQAGTVRDDIDYLLYRNFAENRGPFRPGATDIEVQFKDGSLAGVLNKAPMPDWSGLVTAGFAQLINPQYIATANHNKGFRAVSFGYNNNYRELIDNHEYSYRKVAHNYTEQVDSKGNVYGGDFATPRLDKLVTEATPIAMSPLPWASFNDRSRFPVFYRAGAGTQNIQSADGTKVNLTGAYTWTTGGTITTAQLYSYYNWFLGSGTQGQLFTDVHLPLPIAVEPGDSGSPLIAWDNVDKRWVFIGELY